jgi:hypothetical protein
MIIAFARKGLICAATAGLLVLTMLPGLAQTKKLGDGLTFEGAGASFIGSGQTTTLNCAGGGAHILGSKGPQIIWCLGRAARYLLAGRYALLRPTVAPMSAIITSAMPPTWIIVRA